MAYLFNTLKDFALALVRSGQQIRMHQAVFLNLFLSPDHEVSCNTIYTQ